MRVLAQRDRFEEVARQQGVCLGAQEASPGVGGPFGRGVDAGVLEHLPHRRGGDLHSEDEEFTMHAAIAPPRVLPDQAQYQDADGTHRRWPARPLGSGPGRVPLPDQVAVPAQHRIRAYQQPHPAQRLRSQPVQQRRQQDPIRRGEPDLPSAQLTFEYTNLVTQHQDFKVLVPIAHGKKTHEPERVRHRQVGES
jgi:hypothetical protein